MTDDFDFDFDVGRGQQAAGTRDDEAARPLPEEPRAPDRDRGDRGANGRRDDRAGNGREGDRAANGRRGEHGADGEGDGENGEGFGASARGLLNRIGNFAIGTTDDDEGGNGVNGGRGGRSSATRRRRPPVPRPSGPPDQPPLAYRDRDLPEAEPPAPRRPRAEAGSRSYEPPPTDAPEGDEDWLGLTDDGLSAAPGLDSIAEADDGPAGPPTPQEGRQLARSARRRATGRTRAHEDDGDFEQVLSRQPQKSEVARRGSAVVYGLRGLLDDGRERLRSGRERLGGLSQLRERVPSISRPAPAEGGGAAPPRLPKRIGSGRPRKPKPGRVKKLRLVIIVVGVGALAMVSTVFGMMMAVAGDLPALENEAQFKAAKNSEVFDSEGRKLGTLLSNSQRRLVESEDISPYIKQAVVAIEDERFYEHRGVDYVGILRAVGADILPGGSTQGASTITMQFVKNALEAQDSRTYFQKLREAALAYHLERQWDKDKILTQYLNSIYFGEGAYGIEVAARTYFGWNHQDCLVEGADPCASQLLPEEAALLAGIISSPSAASPRANPEGALARRNLVLTKMVEQDTLSPEEFEASSQNTLPAPSDIEKPQEDSLSPYFTSWLRQQVVDRYGAGRAFSGGLDVHTTIDLDMQQAAEQIAYDTLAGIEPTAAVVVLENETGAVKAMVGGNDYQKEPFNLATNGQRQPGSAFKPFVLSAYLAAGGSSGDVIDSQEKTFIVPNSAGKERFTVQNYEEKYLGSADVASATKYSDNSVFAEMGLGDPPGNGGPLGGIKKGPGKIARLAEAMGIQTGVDRVPAITLGAPSIGFTPLEMTHAFNAIALGGQRVGGTLDSIPGNKSLEELAPVGMSKIVGPEGDVVEKNDVKKIRVMPENVADTARGLLHGPVSPGGTGTRAQTPGDEWGKTGTTENNGDAWFCGGTDHLTACVWVGHAMNNTPMETEFAGEPVDGGTYPALIWGSIMTSLEQIWEENQEEREAAKEDEDEDSDDEGSSYGGSAPSSESPSYDGGGGGNGGGGGSGQATPAPSGGGGGGATGTGGTGL